ncbi:MAG: DUF3368 domain-containing protein [Planctomycetes bacterium]|nr:DUF3368 domain-containing protein [Planctomycetota bacterium]
MPETERVVVANTTPLVALGLVHRLDLLRELYTRVLVPPAVDAEFLAGGGQGVRAGELAAAAWIQVVPLRDPVRAALLSDLDRGEAEVIVLGQELGASLLIIDERLARRHARRLGFRVTGTVGVLLKAKERGLVPRVGPLLEQLRSGGIWLSQGLIAEALRLAGEQGTVGLP